MAVAVHLTVDNWMGRRHTILVFLSVLSRLQYSQSDVVIFEVNPSQGSLFGGTRLVIRGSGFSANTNSASNLVYIGSRYRCDPIPLHSTVNQIICKTQPATDGFYPTYDTLRTGVQNITVVVDGSQTSTCKPVQSSSGRINELSKLLLLTKTM